MSRRLIILALTLLGVFAFTVFAGARPGGLSLLENSASAEERIGEESALFQQSDDNQQVPSEALKAYVEAAIEKYDAEGIDAVKEYYRTQASYHSDLDLRLLLLRDGTIEVNGTFVASEGVDLSGNTDILGVGYGEKIASADDDGDVIEFLVVTDSSDNFTFRKRTAWAKRHDGLVFSSGWTDKETDVETNLFKDNKRLKAVGTAIKAGARLQSNGLFPTVAYYNTPESIDGEFYVILGLPGGNIAADATTPELVGTKISDLTASDDAELGQKIFALAEGEELWITHMWRNPVTGQEERKHTYATRVFGSYIITGYYDESPPPALEPLDATKAYVNEAIRKYDEEGLEATKEYYQSRESIEEELGLYLLLLKGDLIEVNPVFPDARGTGISWRTDPLDRNYGKTLAEADEDGVVVEYLLPIPSDDYTFRKKTAWAIKHDGLVFSAGWTDRETDVESNLTKRQKAIGTVIKVRARMQSETVRPTIAYYRDSKSIDGEYYAILGLPDGSIIADATMPQLVGTQISDLQASDDPQLGQKISALQEGEYLWTTHMWPNPETGQEELKHTYAIRFFGFYIISGYYGEMPPVVDPLLTTQAYVLKAIRAYREDPEEALAYYRSEESIVNDPPGLYLTLLDDDIIKVNPVFPSAEGTSISWRDDPLGNMYGARLAAADEDGLVVEYLIPVSSQDYTYRKKTAWAIRANVPDIDNPGSEVSLVFSAGWLDLETDFESTFTESQKAVGEVIEARARVQAEGAIATLDHYKSTKSIDGEYYVWLAYPTGRIASDVTMPELEGTNIADAYPPEVAQKILGVQSLETRWISHRWPNPETGQEELKHTYVTRFFGFYIISGYYDETPPVVGPRAAAQAYVEDAIRAYREDPEAAKEYYRSEASVDRENDLYLILLDGNEIIVNGGFRGVEGFDITGRVGVDAIGKEFGKELVAADENGTFVDYLIPDPLSNYTLYRKHTWAIRSDGLVFAAGSWDKSEDVESTLEPHEDVVAAIYEAAARLLTGGADGIRNLIQHYNSPESIDGERYVFIIHAATGAILADATMTREELATTRVTDLQASDDPDLGKKIAALQTDEEIWISHMWPNPVTGQEELKHTYVTEFQGLIFGSGYYGETPPGPEPKPTTEYQEVSSGANHVCALDVNGNIDCFGADDQGQATPPQGTFRAVSSGDDHTCAIREDGTLVCWGALQIDTK